MLPTCFPIPTPLHFFYFFFGGGGGLFAFFLAAMMLELGGSQQLDEIVCVQQFFLQVQKYLIYLYIYIYGALHPAIQALFILDADGLFAFRKVYAVNILLSKQTKTTTKLNHKKVRSNHSTESQTGFYFHVFALIIVLFLLFVCLGEGLRHGTLRTFAWLLPSSG